MRRSIIFYFAAALLAFVIGSGGVYFYFYQLQKSADDSGITIRQMTENTSALMRSFKEDPGAVEAKPVQAKKSLSDQEKAAILFEPVISKWLQDESLESMVEPSPAIMRKITEDEFAYADYQDLKQTAEKVYRPTLIDVNGDGNRELAILSNCGADRSCQFWILKKSKEGFNVILSSYREVENFKLQKARTGGFYNIETTYSYLNAPPDFGMKIYKFDGKEYSGSGCFAYNYRYPDKNGKLREAKKPIKSRLHCC